MRKIILIIVLFLLCLISLYAFPNTEMMNSRVGKVSPELQEAVFEDPETNLPELVKFLIKTANATKDKVRIIHDWICNNIAYDAEMFFSGKTKDQDYISVIKKKKGVCSGYSSVFVKMCELAKIQVVRIHGIAKVDDYSWERIGSCGHEWNAVKVSGAWKLVDCCWDAGFVEGRDFVKRYTTQWLFLPAEQFIYSHFPDEEEYQYLSKKKIRTKEQFMNEPFLNAAFFKYGFALSDEVPAFINEIEEGPIYLKFKQNNQDSEAVFYMYRCYKNGNSYNRELANGFVWTERIGNIYECEFDVPDADYIYEVELFAKSSSNVEYPDSFLEDKFKYSILPKAKELISENPRKGYSISQEEFDLFQNAFVRIKGKNSYYYQEDLFNTAQKDAVMNVYAALGALVGNKGTESVLKFTLKASGAYEGYGLEPKYPVIYSAYNRVKNALLVSPKQYYLNPGETYHFEFSGTDFSDIAFVINEKWYHFVKNSKKKKFELDFEVPFDENSLEVFGSKNGINYSSILKWYVMNVE